MAAQIVLVECDQVHPDGLGRYPVAVFDAHSRGRDNHGRGPLNAGMTTELIEDRREAREAWAEYNREQLAVDLEFSGLSEYVDAALGGMDRESLPKWVRDQMLEAERYGCVSVATPDSRYRYRLRCPVCRLSVVARAEKLRPLLVKLVTIPELRVDSAAHLSDEDRGRADPFTYTRIALENLPLLLSTTG